MNEFNVALVVVDTLRKDVMGIYGGEASMPSLEAFSRDSMVFRNCYSPSPWTFPSHVSMFTGMYPKDHGIHEWPGKETIDLIKKLEDYKGFWLPSYFHDLGYTTSGLSGNFLVSQSTGFSRGFDSLFQIDRYTDLPNSDLVMKAWKYGSSEIDILKKLIRQRKFRKVLDYATIWRKWTKFHKLTDFPREKGTKLILSLLENISLKSKFFLFMNLFEMHAPLPGEKKNEVYDHDYGVKAMSLKRANFLKGNYVKEAEHVDHYLGKIISLLKSKGAYENTLIIITSDHGEGFLEHGYLHHGSCLYDEITSVPLIVKPPKGVKIMAGTRMQSLVNIPAAIIRMRESNEAISFDSDTVFSESHANINEFPQKYSGRIEYVNKQYQVSRFAAMRDHYKLSLKGGEDIIEEFTLNGKEIDPKKNAAVFSDLGSIIKDYKMKYSSKESEAQMEIS